MGSIIINGFKINAEATLSTGCKVTGLMLGYSALVNGLQCNVSFNKIYTTEESLQNPSLFQKPFIALCTEQEQLGESGEVETKLVLDLIYGFSFAFTQEEMLQGNQVLIAAVKTKEYLESLYGEGNIVQFQG